MNASVATGAEGLSPGSLPAARSRATLYLGWSWGEEINVIGPLPPVAPLDSGRQSGNSSEPQRGDRSTLCGPSPSRPRPARVEPVQDIRSQRRIGTKADRKREPGHLFLSTRGWWRVGWQVPREPLSTPARERTVRSRQLLSPRLEPSAERQNWTPHEYTSTNRQKTIMTGVE